LKQKSKDPTEGYLFLHWFCMDSCV